ncbi:MAG: DUF134 domain-containing protein [Promethearchaeota archaeon]
MGRRTLIRFVKHPPKNFYFNIEKPHPTAEVLTLAEFEAMRLKHFIDLPQQQAALKMGISQPTFSRILESAHKKITRALIEGKEIRISGGNVHYKKGFVGYGCWNCDYEWEDENASKDRKVNCPKCNSSNVYYLSKEPL